jgi:hypothetical protein
MDDNNFEIDTEDMKEKNLKQQIKQQRQRMNLISDIDVSTLVRVEYKYELDKYKDYYGRIAGRVKHDYLGKMKSE